MSQEENNINETEKANSENIKQEELTNSTNSTNEVEELLTGKTEDKSNEVTKERKDNSSLLLKIFSNVIDQVVMLAISGLVLVIFNFILKFIGYKVIMPLGFLLIFYCLINILYTPIIEKTKLNKSIGKRILNIK